MLSVARYHLRATFRQRWAGYLSIVLLVGLVGGVAMGSIAGARRTQSTFAAYLSRNQGLEPPTPDLDRHGPIRHGQADQEAGTPPPRAARRRCSLPPGDSARIQREGPPLRLQRQRRGGGRQCRRHVLQPGSGDRRPGTDGRSGEHATKWSPPPKPLGSPAGISARRSPSVRTPSSRPIRATFNPLTDGSSSAVLRQARRVRGVLEPSRGRRCRSLPDHGAHDPCPHQASERERDLSHLRASPRDGQPRRAERGTGDRQRSSSRFHLQLPPHIGGRGRGGAGDQTRGDRPRCVRFHRGPCRPADRRSGHQPTAVGQPRGPRCPAIPGCRYADDGGRRHARATLRRPPRRRARGGRGGGVLVPDADRSGQSGRTVTGDLLRLDGALVRSRGAQPRSRRPDDRPRLSREPRDATTNGASPCGRPGWSTWPPARECPNPQSPACASPSSEAVVAPRCPSARR